MGNGPILPDLIQSYNICPMRNNVFRNKKMTDADIATVVKRLDEGLNRYGYLAIHAGFQMDLRGNNFSDTSLQQVANVLYDHGFTEKNFEILV